MADQALQAYRMDWVGGPTYRHVTVNDSSAIPNQGRFIHLDNPIHPLWRPSAFRDYEMPNGNWIDDPFYDDASYSYPDDVYHRMIPALRLASILLHRARRILTHYYLAPIIHFQDGTLALDHNWRASSLDDFKYQVMLRDIQNEYRILRLGPKNGVINTVTHGMTCVYNSLNSQPRVVYLIMSSLSHEIMEQFEDPAWFTRPREAQESVLAHAAQVLVHEFAHAIWMKRCIEDRHDFLNDNDWLTRPEPKIFPAMFGELGTACSHYLWGFEHAITWLSRTPEGEYNAPFHAGEGGLRALVQSDAELHSAVYVLQVAPETIHSYFNALTWEARFGDTFPEPQLTIYLLQKTYDWDQHYQTIHNALTLADGQPTRLNTRPIGPVEYVDPAEVMGPMPW